MRKTLLVLLTVLFAAPMLSGCFCPYGNGWGDRGYRHDGDYYGDRGGSRDYRERR